MLRHIPIFLIILISNTVIFHSQIRFEGVFDMQNHPELFIYEYDKFIFNKNGSFTFYRFTDTGNHLGIGFYEVNDTILHLNFSDASGLKPNDVSKYQIEKSYSYSDDSLEIILYVRNLNGVPLGGPIAVLRDLKDNYLRNEIDNKVYGAEGNEFGKIKFKVHKKILPFSITVSYPHSDMVRIPINDFKSLKINVYMNEQFMFYLINKGEELMYDFIYLNDSSFMLKRKDIDEWLYYVKE